MARQLFPSSFACDCGHQSHFFENTVREMEAYTERRRKPGHLLDSESEEHAIVFENGRATAVTGPTACTTGLSMADSQLTSQNRCAAKWPGDSQIA